MLPLFRPSLSSAALLHHESRRLARHGRAGAGARPGQEAHAEVYGSAEHYAAQAKHREERREEKRCKGKIKRQTKKEHAWQELANGAHASIGVFPPEVLDASS